MTRTIEAIAADMVLLAKVAESGSITAASCACGLERTTVSRRLSKLEDRLGARLLDRSGREVSLTETGRYYNRYCTEILRAAEAAEAGILSIRERSGRLLRVHLAFPDPGRLIGPIARDFSAAHATTRVEFLFDDGSLRDSAVDIDLVLSLQRATPTGPRPAELRAIPQSLWAAPACASLPSGEAGLKALPDRDIVVCLQDDEQPVWSFERDAVGAAVTVRPRYRVQDLERCRDACVSGLGLALLPDYLCENLEAEGSLRRLFPGWSAPPAMLVASSDAGRCLTREARRFVNFFRPGRTIVPLPARVGSA